MSVTTDPARRPPSKKLLLWVTGVVAAVALVAIVSIITGGSVNNNPTTPTTKLVGETMRGFSLAGLNGGTEKAPWESHRASVLIFFASDCPPCKGEMPKVARYLRTHAAGDVQVLGMDVLDERSAAQAFVKKDGVTFPVAFDAQGDVTSGLFDFLTIPETVFVNARGVVTKVYFGAIPPSKLASGIAALRA